MDVLWKDIPGFYGQYQASNTGCVRSLDRVVKSSNGRLVRKKGRVLSQKTQWSGHLVVGLISNNKQRKIHVARLVLAAFYGWPEDGFEACHNDNNKENNNITNLRWDTKAGNYADRAAAGTENKGEKHGCSVLTEKQVIEARKMMASGEKISSVARYFGISQSGMWSIKKRVTWRHI